MSRDELLSLAAILLLSGCGGSADESADEAPGWSGPAATAAAPVAGVETPGSLDPQAQGVPKRSEIELIGDDANVTIYNTGDVDVWPSFDLPCRVIHFDLPEVPEAIQGPFTEADLPPVEE